MQVLLLHGMGRTALSMLSLLANLRRAGYQVSTLGYVAAVEPFGRIVQRVQGRLEILGGKGPYAVVGHSLGGLLVRAALGRPLGSITAPTHLVMLGTPNQPPRLAQRYNQRWLYRWFNGECGQLLARPDFFATLPPLSIPYTIIAGTKGKRGSTSPFGNDVNDGVVSVSETLVSPADAPMTFPVRHTFMMNDRRVHQAIQRVLEQAPS